MTIRLTVDQVVRLFRAYNLSVDAHFFTTNRDEFDIAVAAGYRDEGTGNPGFAILVSPDVPDSQAIYRLYNLATGRHYYTTSLGEARYLEAVFPPPVSGPDTRRNGWRFEGTVGYMFATQLPGTIEIFRLYNSFTGGHLFTTEPADRDFALSIVDQKTKIKPWTQHKSLGFAYFSDPAAGMTRRGPGSSTSAIAAPVVAADTASENPTAPSINNPLANVTSLIATVPSVPQPILAPASALPANSDSLANRRAVVPLNTDSVFADLDGLTDSLLSSDLAG